MERYQGGELFSRKSGGVARVGGSVGVVVRIVHSIKPARRTARDVIREIDALQSVRCSAQRDSRWTATWFEKSSERKVINCVNLARKFASHSVRPPSTLKMTTTTPRLANHHDVTSPAHLQSILSRDLALVSVLYFRADWAQPCEQMDLVVEQLAKRWTNVEFLSVSRRKLVELVIFDAERRRTGADSIRALRC